MKYLSFSFLLLYLFLVQFLFDGLHSFLNNRTVVYSLFLLLWFFPNILEIILNDLLGIFNKIITYLEQSCLPILWGQKITSIFYIFCWLELLEAIIGIFCECVLLSCSKVNSFMTTNSFFIFKYQRNLKFFCHSRRLGNLRKT